MLRICTASKNTVALVAADVACICMVACCGVLLWKKRKQRIFPKLRQKSRQEKQLAFDKEKALLRLRNWLFDQGGQCTVKSFICEYCSLLRDELRFPLDRFCAGASFSLIESVEVPYVSWKWQHSESTAHEFTVAENLVPRSLREHYLTLGAPFSILQSRRASSVRLQAGPGFVPPLDCDWFAAENYQDYYALPVLFPDEFQGGLGWATKQPGGFSVAQIEFLQESLNALSTVMRLHTNQFVVRILATNLEEQVAQRTSELQVANRRLSKAAKHMEEQQALQLQHFAMMSHELRTPLNGLIGMTSVLLDDAEGDGQLDDAQRLEFLRIIASSGDLMRSVVDDVLDYSKLAAGKMETVVETINLIEVTSSVVKAIEMKGLSKSVAVRSHYSRELPTHFRTDGRRLQQVLFNVLGNAVKFSHDDSIIDFSVSVTEAEASTVNGKGQLKIVVKDYGRGIPKEDCTSIFEPFHQLDRGDGDSCYGGTGLGLAITSKIVETIGGSISVESELGKWCEFTILLPSADDEPVSQKTKVPIDIFKHMLFSNNRPTLQHSSSDMAKSEEDICSGAGASTGTADCTMGHSITTQDWSAPQDPAHMAPPPCKMCDLKVLIAEDNLINQKVLNRILMRLGVQNIDLVGNGQEAVNQSINIDYDVILMDFEMPIMNGLEATRIIVERYRQNPRPSSGRRPKIVFLTAHALASFREQAQKAGADSFVSKPCKLQDIKAVLQQLGCVSS